MVREEKDSADEVNTKTLADSYNGANSDKTSSTSSDPGEVIYTPPESVASMSSTKEGDMTSIPQAVQEADAANISIREYIYFMPYPLPKGTPIPYTVGLPDKNPLNLPPKPFEPTSTLVLTSPNHTFVDIRFFKPMRPGEETLLPNRGEIERLEWCFAGQSESHPIVPGVTHSTWMHWLDSRHPVAAPNMPVDEGDMYPIDTDLTLEHGHAFQPLMHAVKTHEEMWRDVSTLSTNSTGSKICVVLRCHADAAGVRGVIVRVGQFCQGIVMKGEQVTAERWEFDFEGEGKEETGNWKRIGKVGDLFLPCAVAFRPEILKQGGRVKYWDFEWVVEDVWEWM
ncbi:hypothetical protein P153DRAFT_332231 [Dothidotthia symphoricarpi CBS 119687]|uniref:Protein HRI1 n=1 Tax=Dothidotthia symphoricarpi CBS 119687 TaxID=1392245 RepID=A0A6A6AR66_9PLEO|nr:uncharacterized protein P153DRAFT_332231 [Dothidotthia symphoricarpi CBS 119687]KAF2133444.1 hypothetical protein P153DRAFT_332231 [Dothidotthia symphoricarpi CBS 119687]